MRMSPFLALIVACLATAVPSAAQSAKPKEPTPLLSALPGQQRVLITKKAKGILQLPDETVIDMSNYLTRMDVIKRSLSKVDSNWVCLSSPDVYAWGLGKESGGAPSAWESESGTGFFRQELPPLVQAWEDGKEKLIKNAPSPYLVRGDGMLESKEPPAFVYLCQSPATSLAGQPWFEGEVSSNPEIVILSFLRYEHTPSAEWKRSTSVSRFACRKDEQIFVRGKVKPQALFLLPELRENKNGPSQPKVQLKEIVNSKEMSLYRMYDADKLKCSPEQVLGLVKEGKVAVIEWTFVRKDDKWNAKSLEFASKP